MSRAFSLLFLITRLALGATQEELVSSFQRLDQEPRVTHSEVTRAEAQELWNAASSHPVARLGRVPEYDPEGKVGFCFGRAMTVHLLARQRGLAESSIEKLFIVGDLRSGPHPEWRFHVTTLLLSEDGQWLAIDPIMAPPLGTGGPLPVSDWIQRVRGRWDPSHRAYLYRTERRVVMPDMRVFAVTPHDETGERLVDLSFRPEERAGFDLVEEFLPVLRVFRAEPMAFEEHFLQLSAPLSTEFDLLGITIHSVNQGVEREKRFDYHGYFGDLLASFESPSAERAAAVALADEVPVSLGLGSFRVPID